MLMMLSKVHSSLGQARGQQQLLLLLAVQHATADMLQRLQRWQPWARQHDLANT